ncbi:hypothetical protein [Variovorax paradoxus]|jgi:hypothetical protein|uniref:hypothetical protein n=1 Tax=Variovorax paradoxus TaxID=34073 RepID=UPI001F3BBF87|nr:hypothetical protein [Variovorax paradoxus]UKI10786.1 hypothetical protein L3V85_13340 [Variovorax paradoxus]
MSEKLASGVRIVMRGTCGGTALGQVVYLSNSSGGDLTVTVRIDSNINPGNAYPQIRSFPVPAHQDVEIGCSKYATGVGLQVLTYNIISY